MSEIRYLRAVNLALKEEMRRNSKVFVVGQSMRRGSYGYNRGLLEEFGEARVRDMPLSENTIVGAGVGAAMVGFHPFIDLAFSNFAWMAMNAIVNEAAKNRYLFGGQCSVPLVLRFVCYTEGHMGDQHTDRSHPTFMNQVGLKVVCPSTPYNARGLYKSAFRDSDPVVIIENNADFVLRGEVPDEEYLIPLGKAEVVKEGSDLTLVSVLNRRASLAAVEELSAQGISVELIDPQTLVPLDTDTILESVAKTGRLVVTDIATETCSAASEIAAIVAEEGFQYLKGPILRVCVPHIHIPTLPPIEDKVFPGKDRIVYAAQQALGLISAPAQGFKNTKRATRVRSH